MGGQADAFLALDIRERNKKYTYPEIEKVARLEHVNGNTYVGREEWRLALKHYERGVKLLEETSLKNEEEENRRQHLMLKLQLNVAYCAIKMKWPKKACTACKEALTIEDNNTKALFRYGKAQRMLEEKRGEVEANFYENFLAELKPFQYEVGKELALPNQWSHIEMRALIAAAEDLNMRVVEEDTRVRVIKES